MSNAIVTRSKFCDVLGSIKAEISLLKQDEEKAKVELISIAANHPANVCALEGDLFRATVSFTNKTVTDYRGAFEELVAKHGMSAEFIERLLKKHTKTAEGVPSIRVSALKVSA